MRRANREVTDPAEIADIMARCEVLHLAFNNDNVPYILPVNFGMEPDGMTLYIHGAPEGTKYAVLDRDNRASFELDCNHGLVLENGECSMNYESVIGWGYIDELSEENDKRHALDQIMKQYRGENFPYSAAAVPRTRILRLRVQERTAKRRKKMV